MTERERKERDRDRERETGRERDRQTERKDRFCQASVNFLGEKKINRNWSSLLDET